MPIVVSYICVMKQELLKREVERTAGYPLRTAGDFEQLSQLLLSHVHESLSPTTLKRFWGYLRNEKVQIRSHTLDVLSRFVGYRNYVDFCAQAERLDQVQSGIISSNRITSEDLRRCQKLIITWRPDRRILVKHNGGGLFQILEAQNTKLCVGDTFRCHLMIQHEPLYMDQVVHQGMPAMTYVAGQKDGVTVEICQ